MEAIDILQQIVQENVKSSQPCALVIGTVVSEKPLKIKTDMFKQPLEPQILYLTEPVVEKKIPILEHAHMGVHGMTDSRLLKSEIICKEHGKDLPVENGYIIFNRRLEVNDKVLMLRVENGQKFIILSRIFEVS